MFSLHSLVDGFADVDTFGQDNQIKKGGGSEQKQGVLFQKIVMGFRTRCRLVGVWL